MSGILQEDLEYTPDALASVHSDESFLYREPASSTGGDIGAS